MLNPLKYQPTKLNLAQRLLVALGVDDLLLVAHERRVNDSFTKKGPGRKHAGPKKPDTDTKPITQDDMMARPGLFFGQHTTSVQRKRRRGMVKQMGIRQFKRQEQQHRPSYPWPHNEAA